MCCISFAYPEVNLLVSTFCRLIRVLLNKIMLMKPEQIGQQLVILFVHCTSDLVQKCAWVVI